MGLPLKESISKGSVVHSVLRATIKEAPNSPKDIARVKTVATKIDPFIKGNLILKKRLKLLKKQTAQLKGLSSINRVKSFGR